MTTASEMFSTHREMLDKAIEASRTRRYYSAFNESPSPRVYGESAAADGQAAFEALRGTTFPLDTPGASGTVSTEKSPFGFDLEVAYPRVSPDGVETLLAAASVGLKAFRDAGPDARLGVCLEILHRLHGRVFDPATAVKPPPGRALVRPSRAGGAHALARALGALAFAYIEMPPPPPPGVWEKPGRGE